MSEPSPYKRRPFETAVAALLAGLSIAGWLIFKSYTVFTGVWAGGLIGVINFKWLGRIVKGALSQGGAARYTVKYLLKLSFVVIVSVLLIFFRVIDPIAFVAGFTISVIAVSLLGAELMNRS